MMNRRVFGVMSMRPAYLRTHHVNQLQVTITSYILYLSILNGSKERSFLTSYWQPFLWGLYDGAFHVALAICLRL